MNHLLKNYKGYESALKNYEFDRYLGTYPLEKHETWQEVANFISSSVLDRLFVFNCLISSKNMLKRAKKRRFTKRKKSINMRIQQLRSKKSKNSWN